MVAGIDEYGPVVSSESYNNSGEADMVSLLIFDETNETIHMLSLNRDTMLEIPVLGIGGKQAGTIHGQLALAHTYGSGLEDSAKNLRDTVSDFLYGLNINYYVTMNMDAISVLNDAVGGVRVTVADDFDDVILGYHCALITPNANALDGRCLNALLHTDYAKKYFACNASGSGQRYALSVEALNAFPVPVISLQEQKRIGDIFSALDKKIALNRAINHNLSTLGHSLGEAKARRAA